MILVIGGKYQGKTAYARDVLHFEEKRIITGVEQMIRKWVEAENDPIAQLKALLPMWQECAVILPEVGAGLVPMDAADRAYREAMGRAGVYLARHAGRVVRVFCGIGTVIKDA